MVGLEAGLSQVRNARRVGRSPSVVCHQIARHAGRGGIYRAEEAGRESGCRALGCRGVGVWRHGSKRGGVFNCLCIRLFV